MGRLISSLPSALDHPEALERVGTAIAPVLFLDFDGTLAPIVEDPANAAIPEDTRDILRDLAARCPVGIVSGRDVGDVRARTALEGLYYAGSHGLEIMEPDGSVHTWERPDVTAALDRAERRLSGLPDAAPGVRVERKRLALAVHLRSLVDRADEPVVERAVRAAALDDPELRLTHGKELLELRPGCADGTGPGGKGHAVRWILERLALLGAEPSPLYVGDDLTDEDAFAALEGRGLRVVVAGAHDRETVADLSVADPLEVAAMLARLAHTLGGSGVARTTAQRP